MRVTLFLVLVLLALSGLIGVTFIQGDAGLASSPTDVLPSASAWPRQVAADGTVEGAKPEVALRPELPGILKTINVRENQDVTQGSLLAELHNETQTESVALAAAELSVAKAQLERLRNGERAERRKALAAVEQARHVVYQQAKADWERTHKLVAIRSSSAEQGDRDYFSMQKAQAEWDEAAAERALVEAPARTDELAAAQGRVDMAEARLRLVAAELGKTRLLAPTDGRILHVHCEPGEVAGPNTRLPVVLLADLSRRRVRAFVEELDAARVQVGQHAIVRADGVPGKEFTGTVSVTFPRMGRPTLKTDAASEYKDVFKREVLIDLDAGEELPLDLRVHTLIEAGVPKEMK